MDTLDICEIVVVNNSCWEFKPMHYEHGGAIAFSKPTSSWFESVPWRGLLPTFDDRFVVDC